MRKFSEEARQKLIARNKSRVFSEEDRKKISERMKGHPDYTTPESHAKGAEKLRGRHHSEEHKRHQSEANKGRIAHPNSITAAREQMKNRVITPKMREERSKKQIERWKIWRESLTEEELQKVLSRHLKGPSGHKMIYEESHGPVPLGFVIHHKDGDKRNNEIENLIALPRGEHTRLHNLGRYKNGGTPDHTFSVKAYSQ